MPDQPNFPIPSVINPEKTRCIKLNIPDNDDWVRVFVGLLAQPTYWFNWERTGDTQGSQCGQVWSKLFDKIDWSTMSCCEDPLIRLNPDGSISISTDGGATYHTDNNQDPRYTLPQFPLQTGESANDTKCKAANSIVRQMKDYVAGNAAQIGTLTTIAGMAASVIALAVAVFFDPALIPFLIAAAFELAAALLLTTSAAYTALFTDDEWSWVLCEVYCKLNEDGSFKPSQFVNMQSDFDSHFSGNAALTFSSLLNVWQVPGLNRAASIPTTDNLDCSGCCPSCTGNFTWPTSVFGANSTIVIDEDANTITADALETNPGTWYWAFQSEVCCTCTVEITSGIPAIAFRGVIPCPTLPSFSYGDESVPPWVLFTLPINDTPAFVVYIRSVGEPFSARVTFS